MCFPLITVLHSKCIASFHCIIFNCCMASFCIRVDAVSEDVYELVAERVQEPQAGEQEEDAVEHAPEEIANFDTLGVYTLVLHTFYTSYACFA